MIKDIKQTFALCSLYSRVDEHLKEYSNNALNVCTYEGKERLAVVQVDDIISVVAMVPFGAPGGGAQRFFLVEKFALGVVDTGVIGDED